MNSCFQLSFFPDAWRSSKVLIIGKPNKPSYDSLNSFRPISLINNFAKILEKIILGRLQWFAKNENWFSSNQHGFTDGRSTESACHSLTSFIQDGFKSKQVTACAFLDIKSAFDSAWHPAILAALLKRKCPHYLFCLVRCFLADRTALLSHNDSDLSIKVNLGCPQGGVLSPFLCNVLIDDILRLRFPFPFLSSGYADDLTVATSHKDPHMATANLQLVCNAIVNWCAESKLTLNAIKTVFMLFSRKALEFATISLGLSIYDVNIFLQMKPNSSASFLTID
jgi:hypothetical protein